MNRVKLILLLICFCAFMPVVHAEVSVFVNEKEVMFDDQPPVIVDNRTFVPLRKIFEELGASVDWISSSNTVYASKRFSYLTLTVGEEMYIVNGEEKKLDAPAFSLNDRVLIPARAVSEALGAEVKWIKEENSVHITLLDGEYNIKDCYMNGSETADDGTVVMTYRVAYPEIQSNDSVCMAFNEFIKGDAEETSLKTVAECLPSAKETYSASLLNSTEFIPYMYERNFDITYNADNILSVVCSDCNFSGGFHPSYNMNSMTYNLETGRIVEISEVLCENEINIRERVYRLFENKIVNNPELYYSDSLDCLNDALYELKWYLSDDGVHFYLNPYEIAPYSAGVVDVVIPL